jgi:hypothetical protein
MGGACSTYRRKSFVETSEIICHFKDTVVDWRIIYEQMLKEQGVVCIYLA